MASSCIRHTELPHTTKLFADFVYHFECVARFYHHPPFDPESYQAAAAELRFEPARRAALVEALRQEKQNTSPEALRNLDLLSQKGTPVVVAGQQVGLYTGPVFTIYKALSAAKLAADLTGRGIPTVPVFWLATEDHDLGEVNHVWMFDSSNRPLRLEAAALARPNQPVGDVPLTDPAGESVRATLAGLPYGPQVSAMAAQAYSGGATFASGFKSLLAAILAPYGVLLLDPQSPAIRRLAAPLMAKAIQAAPQLTAALRARGAELEQAGYHVQVHWEDKTSLFFLLEAGSRTALRRSGDSYATEGATHSRSQLLSRLESSPEDFSPNVLLRPVVQDFLLPTVAYFGGPAELAYLAQSEVLYRRLLGRMPVAAPRASFTILDAKSDKLLSRYGLTVLDAMHGLAALEQRIANTLVPDSLQNTFLAAHDQLENALESVNTQLLGFDPTLAAAWGGSRRKIQYQLGKIRDKVGRESLRRADRARADAAWLNHLIFPEKIRQERLYSVLPFLARHGVELIGRLYDAIHFDCRDHQVLVA